MKNYPDVASVTRRPGPKDLDVPKPSCGGGGAQRTYLQGLVTKLALERGFAAETEAPVLADHGAVDVLLSIGRERFACEISINAPAEYELQNVRKCFAAGIDHVVVLGYEQRKLRALERLLARELSAESLQKTQLCQPAEFLSFLDTTVAKVKMTTSTVRGYKVNVSYKLTSKAEQKRRQDAVAKLIIDSLRRMRD